MDLSVMASTSASHNPVVMIPSKFHPPSQFCFRSARLDQRMKNVHSGQEWCERYSWLHYDVSINAAFCYIYMYEGQMGGEE